ncbi:hypothetical protein T07_3255 [Trichinella nelsoni]|uniref:Uncharacterized protein n=1 Tax=Trichinella nelsoni TaxID=6336 RepID=A0A0V0RBJ3_9BILA|nr:hypothetical protein T07_3255 [Trichinella nelsoni]
MYFSFHELNDYSAVVLQRFAQAWARHVNQAYKRYAIDNGTMPR